MFVLQLEPDPEDIPHAAAPSCPTVRPFACALQFPSKNMVQSTSGPGLTLIYTTLGNGAPGEHGGEEPLAS